MLPGAPDVNDDEVFTLDALMYNLAVEVNDKTFEGTDSGSLVRV